MAFSGISADGNQPLSRQLFPPGRVYKFAKKMLMGNGVPETGAETVARCLVAADLRGMDSHGVNRIPSYMARIREGVLDPAAISTLQ
jgi:LDH2 family malate/lactate/ureidoglycolate dehydrogenase